jgi:2'-5' RNA ligase
MIGDQPLSFMIKPHAEIAGEIDRRRPSLGIDRRYDRERLHTTVLPLWDARDHSPARAALVYRAAASLHIEPFPIAFDKLRGNALVCTSGMRALHAFQKCLVRYLIAFGLPVPVYRFRPHLSLVYGVESGRNMPIPPIGWQVEDFLLIRSIHGEGRHEELGRWPLIARQGAFDF